MKNWNNKEITVAHSKGGVIVTDHPYENLIHHDYISWPPPEIVQKLYQSRQIRAFSGEDKRICTSGLGYYCDLQSMHSEDAITWSVFGTISRAPQPILKSWLADFFQLLGLHKAQTDNPEIFLWRRLPHPDTLVSGGPEIDVGIYTGNAILLVEAKWQSGVGYKQGKKKDKDQIQLRVEFLEKYGPKIFPNRTEFAVAGISLFPEAFASTKPAGIIFESLTWDQVCGLRSHPQAAEVERYCKWKSEFIKSPKKRIQKKGATANNEEAINKFINN